MPESKKRKRKSSKQTRIMETESDALYESCAGLDVHQETVVACVLFGPLDRRPKKVIETFSTTTSGLLKLSDFLSEHNVTHVAMESTSVYWKPVWNVLEGSFTLLLANARTIKNVPGRKTDIKDAEWIAKLLRNGLIESSFVPPEPIRDLRDMTRYRKKLIADITAEKNRIHKFLQDANIKLTTYMSDIFGVSGRNLLQAIINGEKIEVEDLKKLVKGKLCNKIPELQDALNGRLRQHHREMIGFCWKHIEALEQLLAELESRIAQALAPYQEEVELLKSLSLIKDNTAAVIISELGTNMDVFPSEKHISSWAGVSPGNNESAGKKKHSKTTYGNAALKSALNQCAWAASKKRGTRLNALFWRITRKHGKKKAAVATAHEILIIVYYMLKNKTPYNELGEDYFKKKQVKSPEDAAIKLLTKKGYIVTLPEGKTA